MTGTFKPMFASDEDLSLQRRNGLTALWPIKYSDVQAKELWKR